MYIESLPSSLENRPFILIKDESVIEVSRQFSQMTEFNIEVLMSSSIHDIFRLLRVGPHVDMNDIDEQKVYFLFTKSLQVRFINIKVLQLFNRKVYIFCEKPNSNLDAKLPVVNALYLDNSQGIAIYSMPDMRLLKANDKYLGFNDKPFDVKENCIGRHISEFAEGFKGSNYEEIWKTVLKTGKPYILEEFEYKTLRRGTTYWKQSFVPVSEDNEIIYCVLMTTEITESVLKRRRLEEQVNMIKHQNKELEAVIENMSDAVFIVDKDNRFVLMNQEARNNYFDADTTKTLNDVLAFIKLMDADGKQLKLEEMPSYRALKGEKITNVRLNTERFGKQWVTDTNASPIYDDNGEIIMAVVSIRDMSKFIEKEKIIEQQKELLETIIESMNDAIMVYDKDGIPAILNAEARRMYPQIASTTLNGIEGEYEFFDLEGNPFTAEDFGTTRALKGENVRNARVVMKGIDSLHILEINVTPIFNNDKVVTSIVVTHRDITEKIMQQGHLLEVEREKSEAMEKAIEIKDEFLSVISHEFRTPLSVISTAVQAINLLCANDLTDRLKRYINIIRQNTFRQLRLVNNLLDITRADAGRIKIYKTNRDIVFLTRSIVDSVHTYAFQKGVRLTFASRVGEKIIGIDEEKYERILLNLLSNAIKFTPAGNFIEVKLRQVKKDIYIEVKDKGIGIPEDKIDLIFERFGQVDSSLSRQAEGAGIGLSLVKRLIEALGGSISVKSKIGKGSTFTIKLPKDKLQQAEEESAVTDSLDNHLVQVTKVEFSDIYL